MYDDERHEKEGNEMQRVGKEKTKSNVGPYGAEICPKL